MVDKQPRGVRLNNPGNIRLGDDWKGLDYAGTDKSFCTFVSPQYGIRALCKILRKYQVTYKLNTVASIINRYAPTIENDTKSYISSVAKNIGVKPTDAIDVFDSSVALELVKAIIKHENGIQPYSDQVILEGIALL
jgi:hypothetical protein